ncbi:unnamed protein product, partial [Phaeothamnion confervicola]
VTREVAALSLDPKRIHGLLWNPGGASLDRAWLRLGLNADATIAVVGGAQLFGLFLDLGYDTFFLSHCRSAAVPGGRLVFPEMDGHPDLTPQDVLKRHRYRLHAERMLDVASDTVLEEWTR